MESESISRQCAGALFLRAEGSSGASCLPLLLERCKSIEIDDADLDNVEKMLVAYGAISLGTIVNEIGYDPSNELHTEVKAWLLRITSSRHNEISAFAMYGIGDLAVSDEEVLDRLVELVQSKRSSNDVEIISLRGIAFRILAQLDQSQARTLVDTPACREFLDAVQEWRAVNPDERQLEMKSHGLTVLSKKHESSIGCESR